MSLVTKRVPKLVLDTVSAAMHSGFTAPNLAWLQKAGAGDRLRASQIRGWHELLNDKWIFVIDSLDVHGEAKHPEDALSQLLKAAAAKVEKIRHDNLHG